MSDAKKRTDSYWLPDDPPKVVTPLEIDWSRVVVRHLGRALFDAGWEAIKQTPQTDNLVIALLEMIATVDEDR